MHSGLQKWVQIVLGLKTLLGLEGCLLYGAPAAEPL